MVNCNQFTIPTMKGDTYAQRRYKWKYDSVLFVRPKLTVFSTRRWNCTPHVYTSNNNAASCQRLN